MDNSASQQRAYVLLKEIAILSQLATTEFNRILPEGLHVSHFTIIEHLSQRQEGQTPLELARVFQMSKQNMTNSVAQLKKRGFVDIQENPRDGRSKLVTVTEAGRSFRDRAVTALAPMLTEVAAHSSFAQLDAALPFLQELRKLLDENRNIEVNRDITKS